MAISAKNFRRMMNLYPPYLGAGVNADRVSDDFLEIDVSMPLRFYNRNYVGTHFGGSLYSMTDPFYMLMLMQYLGKDHYIWDKTASIDFKAPGKTRVFAQFRLSLAQIEEFRRLAQESDSAIYPEFEVRVTDEEGTLVALVKKTVYIKRKK